MKNLGSAAFLFLLATFVVGKASIPPNSQHAIITIHKELDEGKPLSDEKKAQVELTFECGVALVGNIRIKPVLPKYYSPNYDLRIFFANEDKNIYELLITQEEIGKAYFIKSPNSPYSTYITDVKLDNGVYTIPGTIQSKNIIKASAALVERTDNGLKYNNYYGIKNFKISIPDLMVVEEYLKLPICP